MEEQVMKKYKVALLRPFYESTIITPPLGIGYLSSYLKNNGYDVILIDALKDNLNKTDVLWVLQNNAIDVLGITCVSSFYKEVIDMSLFVKKHNENIKVVVGGVHPTFLPYQTLLESKCDYVVCGEGENALKELLDNHFDNTGIRGVYSLNELTSDKAHFTKAEAILKLDDIPFPDWEQMRPATYPAAPHGVFIKKRPIGIISSSRGCPYSCKFCASPNFYDRKIRFRSPKNVVDEISLLVDKYHVKEIHFEDDNLTMNRQHIVNICELILENNIRVYWSCPNGIRADKIDDDLIKLMKKSGFYACALGIESANMQILKNINKKENIDTIKDAISILRKNKIEVCGFFIFGLPGETKETIRETIEFSLKSGLTRANFNALSVMPGCDLFDELYGDFIPDFSANMYRKPNYLPVAGGSGGATLEEIMMAQSIATKKFYLRLPVLLNSMRYIKFSYLKRLFKRLREYHVFGTHARH